MHAFFSPLFFSSPPSLSAILSYLSSVRLPLSVRAPVTFSSVGVANPYRVAKQPVTSLPTIPTTAPVQSCYRDHIRSSAFCHLQPPIAAYHLYAHTLSGAAYDQLLRSTRFNLSKQLLRALGRISCPTSSPCQACGACTVRGRIRVQRAILGEHVTMISSSPSYAPTNSSL